MHVRVYFLVVHLKSQSPLWMGALRRLFGSLGVVIDGNSVSRRLVIWRSVGSKLCVTFWVLWVRLVIPSNYVI